MAEEREIKTYEAPSLCEGCLYKWMNVAEYPCRICTTMEKNGYLGDPTHWVGKSAEILDSGERTQFHDKDGHAIGVRDMHEGKGRMDLLPWEALIEVSKHCENGAKKYGEHNVDLGIPVHSLIDSGLRHAAKFVAGHEDEPHLVAACWNFLWALQMVITMPDMVDVPWVPEDETDGDGR